MCDIAPHIYNVCVHVVLLGKIMKLIIVLHSTYMTIVEYVCVQSTLYMYIYGAVFLCSCLATKVFIGNLPAMGRGWVIIKLTVNWGAFNPSSHAPQLLSDKYYVQSRANRLKKRACNSNITSLYPCIPSKIHN